jgi:hypothetical protein
MLIVGTLCRILVFRAVSGKEKRLDRRRQRGVDKLQTDGQTARDSRTCAGCVLSYSFQLEQFWQDKMVYSSLEYTYSKRFLCDFVGLDL